MTGRTWMTVCGLLLLSATAMAASPPEGPPELRACCALGRSLPVRLGPLRTPVELDNVADPKNLGRHAYRDRSLFDEDNGVVLTCAGGFIDLGHVRATADMTGYLYNLVRPLGLEGGEVVVALPDGDVHLEISPMPHPEADSVAVAQQAAYLLAVWHEVLTWHGVGVTAVFPEGYSAFSPEDLYSDMVGAWIAGRALQDSTEWDHAVDEHLRRALNVLAVRDASTTKRALAEVAGLWWNPSVSLPDSRLLVRRRFDWRQPLSAWNVGVPECADIQPMKLALPPWPRSVRFRLVPTGEAQRQLKLPSELALGPAEITARVPAPGSELSAGQYPMPHDLALTHEGIQVLPLWGHGGGLLGDYSERSIGFGVVGARVSSAGGDLSLLRYEGAVADGELRSRITGLQSRGLFGCSDDGAGQWHAPAAAWMHACPGGGWLGAAGTIAQLTHDGSLNRTVIRPLELRLAVNPFGNSHAASFLRRHLVLTVGLGLEHAVQGSRSELSVPVVGGIALRLASRQLTWAIEGFADARYDLRQGEDRSVEMGLELTHRVKLRDRDERLWGSVLLGARLGYAAWREPFGAYADRLIAHSSDAMPGGLEAQVTLGWVVERWRL